MRIFIAAAVPLVISCASPAGNRRLSAKGPEGIDPSRDQYLSETFLDLGVDGERSLDAGIGVNTSGGRGGTSTDAYIKASEKHIRAEARIRRTGNGRREAFHLLVAPTGGFRIDAGDFVPDFGAGLVSSGRRFSYPFSSGYPFYRARGIRGWTGLYGSFVRGLSASWAGGPLVLTMMAGQAARHETDGTFTGDKPPVSGIRLETGRGRVRAGLATIDGGSRLGSRITSFDASIHGAGGGITFEASLVAGRPPAAAWGLSFLNGQARCGIIGWSVPSGCDGYLASFPGLSMSSRCDRSGLAASVSANFPGRLNAGLWGEARRSGDGERRGSDSSLRCELGLRRFRWRARCSYRLKTVGTEDLIPYPPGGDPERECSSCLVIGVSRKLPGGGSLNIETRRPAGDGYGGTLAGVRCNLVMPRVRCRLSVSAVIYTSHSGTARFSFYEPACGRSFPWRTVSGSGRRLSILVDRRGGMLETSIRMLWADGERLETSAMITLSI